jgi:glucose-6-phosphate dehydrogenase assembly protein OpcA
MSAAAERVILGDGKPVDLAGVESAFSGLWRQAGEKFGGAAEGSVVRACLWNLVAHLPEPGADPHQVQRLEKLLADITLAVPCRVIRMVSKEAAQAPKGVEVQATVATHCVPATTGGGTVCAEEVTLTGFGESGAAHFPPLVRALRVPDLPVALLWLDGLPPKGRVVGQLLQTTDRMLVDSHFMSSDGALVALQEMLRGAASLSDLGWMRLTPMRYLIAKLFDPPGHADNLARLEAIEVETTPDGLNEGLLLLGWLLSRAGLGEFKAMDVGETRQRFRWHVRRGNVSFPIDLSTRPGFSGYDYDGILRLSVVAGGERYAMEQVDEEHVALESPHHSQQRVALHGWEDGELIISALQFKGTDRIYTEALAVAARLVDTEAWNR